MAATPLDNDVGSSGVSVQLESGVGKRADAVANCPPLDNFLLSYALKFQKPGVCS